MKLPRTLKALNSEAFHRCRDLHSVEFSEGLEKIKAYSFARSGLEEVLVPKSVREIATRAFYNCW